MSASVAGSGTVAAGLRTKASRVEGGSAGGATGFHRVAGATVASIESLRGPVRRSSSGAIDRGQVAAAVWRSDSVSVTRASFSASANVAADTDGPDTGPVPKVGGAPAVVGAEPGAALCGSERQPAATAIAPIGAVIRNFRLVFIPLPCALCRVADISLPQPLQCLRQRLLFDSAITVPRVAREGELVVIALCCKGLGHRLVGHHPIVHVVSHDVRIEQIAVAHFHPDPNGFSRRVRDQPLVEFPRAVWRFGAGWPLLIHVRP